MIYVVIAVIAFIVDCIIKGIVEKRKKLGEETKALGGKLILTKYYNKGGALNFLEKHPHRMAFLHTGILGFLTGIFVNQLEEKRNPGLLTGIALMLGGGANNLFDRIRKGHVVDYFSFGTKWKKLRSIVFNLSDMFVFLGGILAVIFKRK